jgi:OOP family OmpA-OmpF porin
MRKEAMNLAGWSPGTSTRSRRAAPARRAAIGLLLAAALAAFSGPAHAQVINERIVEISPLGGFLMLDENTQYESTSFLTGLRVALNNSAWWGFEGSFAVSPAQALSTRHGMLESYQYNVAHDPNGFETGYVITNLETSERVERHASTLYLMGGSMFLHLSQQRIRPYINVGAGYLYDATDANKTIPGHLSEPYWDFGFGVRYLRPNGFSVNLGVHDLVMRKDDLERESTRAPIVAALKDVPRRFYDPSTGLLIGVLPGGGEDGVFGSEPFDPVTHDGKRWLNNYSLALTVSFPFGWVWKDDDGDQVANRFDNCLTTAPGVVVDAVGCGIDSDEDGVFDGIDRCDATPVGATVDPEGCPSDTDEDGVLDGIDLMDDTPPGALVDNLGRHFDTDGDGILDGLDLCNDTPIGASITEDGCADDPLEERLLRGETIVVQEVEFEPASDEIEPLSYHYINKVARLLERWTGDEDRPAKIEIGVHTDGTGSTSLNQELSQRRAESLRVYLLENYFDMGANNLVATGYGETLPIANNSTPEGRAANRRLEVHMLGPGEPPEEWDFGAEEEAGGEELGEEGTAEEEEFDFDSLEEDFSSDDEFDLDSLFQDDELFGGDDEGVGGLDDLDFDDLDAAPDSGDDEEVEEADDDAQTDTGGTE